jgi:putative DNA primase/helicase
LSNLRADKVENRPVKWLWKERIPEGMITVLAGNPGSRKSLFACRIAADVSKRGTVLLSCEEDPLHEMIGPRLTANGSRRNRIIVGYKPDLPDEHDELARMVRKYNIRLVVIDPVNVHLSDGVRRYNDSIRQATNPLKKLGVETGCAFLLIDHTIKNPAANSHPIAAIGGANSGLAAAARMAYLLGRDPADRERLMLCNVKSNLRIEPDPYEFALDTKEVAGVGDMPFVIDVGEDPDFDVKDLLKHGKPGKGLTKMEVATGWLHEYLLAAPNNEYRAALVIEDAASHGLTKATLEKAKQELGIDSVKRNRDWWWVLPAALKED